jgi:hypothetical protein
MTLSALQIASILLLPWLAGVGVLRLIGCRFAHDRMAFLGWAYVAGSTVTGAIVFLALALHVPLDARYLAPAVGGIAVLSLAPAAVIQRDASGLDTRTSTPTAARWERALFHGLVLLLVIVTGLRILDATLVPITEGDEARIFARRAQWLFHAGRFDGGFLDMARVFGKDAHLDYPPLNPLLQIWVFSFQDGILHVENRLPVALAPVALVLILASALRRHVRPLLAAMLLLLVFEARLTNAFSRSAIADGLVALGVLSMVDAWLRWRRTGRAAWWRLSMLSAAFLAASKNEGALYLLVALGCVALGACFFRGTHAGDDRERRPTWRDMAWASLPLATLAVIWTLNARLGFENDLVNRSTVQTFLGTPLAERLRLVAGFLSEYVVTRPEQSAHIWAIFLLLLLASPWRALRGETRWVALFLLLLVGGFVLVYLATPRDLEWHLGTSAERVFYPSLPIAALGIALQCAARWPRRAGAEPPAA